MELEKCSKTSFSEGSILFCRNIISNIYMRFQRKSERLSFKIQWELQKYGKASLWALVFVKITFIIFFNSSLSLLSLTYQLPIDR